MHTDQSIKTGVPPEKATKALVMLHGRGATSNDILQLTRHLIVDDFHIVAPQATNNTWYPYGFMAPVEHNEPWLSSALDLLNEISSDLNGAGIKSNNIYWLGFSQGACLTLEFVCRNAQKWGGVVAFTGGLIGDRIYSENYWGDFQGAEVFIGNSDNDPHVPLSRSQESCELMKDMKANVTLKIYPNMGHVVSPDEIDAVNQMFFSSSGLRP